MINNNSSSRLKLSPIDKKFLLNILLTLNTEVLNNSIGEPIITMSDDQNVIIIGINYSKPIIKFSTILSFSNEFILYILENKDSWLITRSVQLSDFKGTKLNNLVCSSDGGDIAGGCIIKEENYNDSDLNKETVFSYVFIYNYKECVQNNGLISSDYNNVISFRSDKDSMLGYSLALSRDGNKIYMSSPCTKLNENINYVGCVTELTKIDNKYTATRTILLPSSITDKNKNIYLGLELELLNKDNTLAMTSFGSFVYTYILNKQEDLDYDCSDGPKICYIDELFNVV